MLRISRGVALRQEDGQQGSAVRGVGVCSNSEPGAAGGVGVEFVFVFVFGTEVRHDLAEHRGAEPSLRRHHTGVPEIWPNKWDSPSRSSASVGVIGNKMGGLTVPETGALRGPVPRN